MRVSVDHSFSLTMHLISYWSLKEKPQLCLWRSNSHCLSCPTLSQRLSDLSKLARWACLLALCRDSTPFTFFLTQDLKSYKRLFEAETIWWSYPKCYFIPCLSLALLCERVFCTTQTAASCSEAWLLLEAGLRRRRGSVRCMTDMFKAGHAGIGI